MTQTATIIAATTTTLLDDTGKLSNGGLQHCSAAATNGVSKMLRSDLNLTETDYNQQNGLRARHLDKSDHHSVLDENNNVAKVDADPGDGQADGPTYSMWGFFKVTQPVKVLNSILIPIYHLVMLYAFLNLTLATKFATVIWGKCQ